MKLKAKVLSAMVALLSFASLTLAAPVSAAPAAPAGTVPTYCGNWSHLQYTVTRNVNKLPTEATLRITRNTCQVYVKVAILCMRNNSTFWVYSAPIRAVNATTSADCGPYQSGLRVQPQWYNGRHWLNP